MPAHVVILGAGFGGLELATRLSDSVPDEGRDHPHRQERRLHVRVLQTRHPVRSTRPVRVVELLRRDRKAGRRVPAGDGDLDRPGAPADRHRCGRPTTPTSWWWRSGPTTTSAATPGLAEDGYEFYSPAGAERAREALAAVRRRRRRRRRARPVLQVPRGAQRDGAAGPRLPRATGPARLLDDPPGQPDAHADPDIGEDVFGDHGHPRGARHRVLAVVDGDPARSPDPRRPPRGRTGAALRPVPRHPGPLRSRGGPRVRIWPRTDGSRSTTATFATRFPGVFAVGDVTSAPVPRAGGIAEGEAAHGGRGADRPGHRGIAAAAPYDGAGACYVELGDELVGGST